MGGLRVGDGTCCEDGKSQVKVEEADRELLDGGAPVSVCSLALPKRCLACYRGPELR